MDLPQMIVMDLDDTLLTSNKEVPRHTADILWKIRNKGVSIAYITARTPRKVGLFLKGLPCDAIAYFNGAKVYCSDHCIATNCIPHAEAQPMLAEVLKQNPTVRITANSDPYCFFSQPNPRVDNKLNILTDFSDIPTADFERLLFWTDRPDEIYMHATRNMHCFASVHGNVVVTHTNARKDAALKRIVSELNIDADHVVSFGDDVSDIDLLRASGVGVAMGNAVKELKLIAAYVTASNDEEGVASFLESHYLQ